MKYTRMLTSGTGLIPTTRGPRCPAVLGPSEPLTRPWLLFPHPRRIIVFDTGQRPYRVDSAASAGTFRERCSRPW